MLIKQIKQLLFLKGLEYLIHFVYIYLRIIKKKIINRTSFKDSRIPNISQILYIAEDICHYINLYIKH